MSATEKASASVPGAGRYQCEIDVASQSTHARVIRLVGEGKRVLELGCATGYMSLVLAQRRCTVVAVEIDEEAAARAAEHCERVIVGDIEQLDLARELGDDCFDVVVAADFLEHLRDPLTTLVAVKPFLNADGHLVASIPNVAHASVRLALLTGRFCYSESGLLDRTHLRFFTRESVERLLEDAGFAITRLDRQERSVEASEVSHDPAAVPEGVRELLATDPDASTYQFIVVASPGTPTGLETRGIGP